MDSDTHLECFIMVISNGVTLILTTLKTILSGLVCYKSQFKTAQHISLIIRYSVNVKICILFIIIHIIYIKPLLMYLLCLYWLILFILVRRVLNLDLFVKHNIILSVWYWYIINIISICICTFDNMWEDPHLFVISFLFESVCEGIQVCTWYFYFG